MKRIGNLFEKVISFENLELADINARKGKTKSKGVLEHDKNRVTNIMDLYLDLKNKKFTTSKYTTFVIFDKKERDKLNDYSL